MTETVHPVRLAEALDQDRMGELRRQVLAGLDGLAAAQAAAAGDIPTAQAAAEQATMLAQQAAAQRALVAGWNPILTVAGLVAIRDQMITMLDRQTLIMQAFADLYRYRAANNADAILSHQASEFLARFTFWAPEAE